MRITLMTFIVLLVLSVAVNIFFLYQKNPFHNEVKSATDFRLINPNIHPSIDSNEQPQSLILHYQDLRPQVEEEAAKIATDGAVGIFLQDVKTGAWLGVNEKEPFVPASLLKIPLMMAMLKKVERGEIQLTDTIELTSEDLNSNAGELYTEGSGKELTVWELIKLMILTSDNTAKNAIKRNLMPAEINAVFAHVGIDNPYEGNEGEVVTPRGFVRIFRSLYHATFLTPELSEKALDLTTDTERENLISAGLPPEIQVAHKYGERSTELADCGIVYHPTNPYYLCIMTKDIEHDRAKDLIANISRIIYEHVSSK